MTLSFLKKLSVKKQHLILIGVPALGLLFLGGSLAWQSYQKAVAAEADEALVQVVSQVSVDIMDVIEQLQIERELAIKKVTQQDRSLQDAKPYIAQFPNTDAARQGFSSTIDLLQDYAHIPSGQEAIDYLTLWLEDGPKYSCDGNGGTPNSLVVEREIFADTEPLGEGQGRLGRRTPQALRYYRRQIDGLYFTAEKLIDLIESAEMRELMQGYLSLSKAIENMNAQNVLALTMYERGGKFRFWEPVEMNYATAGMRSFTQDYKKRTPRELQEAYDLNFTEEQHLAYDSVVVRVEAVGINHVEPMYPVEDWKSAIAPFLAKYAETLERYSNDLMAYASANSSSYMSSFYVILVVVISVVVASWIVSKFIGGQIEHSLSGVAENLSRASSNVSQTSDSANRVSNGLSKDASDFAAAMEEVSSTLEELSSMVDNSNQHAHDVQQKTSTAETTVRENLEKVNKLEEAMQDLDTSSGKISSIIKTIEEIAFQTNILALNAAVEAARAGEAGAGFAVVADEVRNLAQRCAKAASETGGIIHHSTEVTQRGNALTEEVVTSFSSISEQVEQISNAGQSIADSVEQQSQGIHQINSAIQQHSHMAQHLASVAHEMIENSQSMSNEVEGMNQNVDTLGVLVGNRLEKASKSAIAGLN